MSSCSQITALLRYGTRLKNWDNMVPGVETPQNELLGRQRVDAVRLEAVNQELEPDPSRSERTRCVDACVSEVCDQKTHCTWFNIGKLSFDWLPESMIINAYLVLFLDGFSCPTIS